MNEKMDAGDIALQGELKIEANDTSQTLDGKLAMMGAELLMDAVEQIKEGRAHFIKQNEKDVIFAPKLTKKDGKINWNLETAAILNRIRGLKPWPGTYSFLEDRVLKIISAEAKSGKGLSRFLPGQIVTASEDSGLVVKTGDGALSILELQLEGKKPMPAKVFLRGYKIAEGLELG